MPAHSYLTAVIVTQQFSYLLHRTVWPGVKSVSMNTRYMVTERKPRLLKTEELPSSLPVASDAALGQQGQTDGTKTHHEI